MAIPIGKQLQDARLARGLTLDDIQHRTRISRTILAAMENDDLGAFPNQTYARKFFAAYARHLGIEVEPFLRRFHAHGLRGVVRYNPYLQPPSDSVRQADRPPIRGQSPAPAAALYIALAALVITAGLAIWAGLRDRHDSATTPPPSIPNPAQPAAATPGTDAAPPSPDNPPVRVSPITPPDLPVRRASPADEADPAPAKAEDDTHAEDATATDTEAG